MAKTKKYLIIGASILGIAIIIASTVTLMATFWQAFMQGGSVTISINHYHEMYFEATMFACGTIPVVIMFIWFSIKVLKELILFQYFNPHSSDEEKKP